MPTFPKSHEQRARASYPGPSTRADSETDRARRMSEDIGREIERLRNTGRWSRQRARYRSEHPWCVECEKIGETRPMEVLDHIVPARVMVERYGAEAFFRASNLQGLCATHDSLKQQRERA